MDVPVLFLMSATLISYMQGGEAYSPTIDCRFKVVSPHGKPAWGLIRCPTEENKEQYSNIPLPLYCCGPEDDKTCCQWTAYVVSYIGGGSVKLGLAAFVGIFVVSWMDIIKKEYSVNLCINARPNRDAPSGNLNADVHKPPPADQWLAILTIRGLITERFFSCVASMVLLLIICGVFEFWCVKKWNRDMPAGKPSRLRGLFKKESRRSSIVTLDPASRSCCNLNDEDTVHVKLSPVNLSVPLTV